MTSSTRRRASLVTAALTATMLPVASMAAYGATEVVAAPLSAPSSLVPDDSHAAFPHQVLKTVRLDWAPVAGATGYRVQLGRDGSWSADPVLTQDVVSSELTLPVTLPHGTYLWRVAALKGSSLGHWSSESGQPQSEAEFTRGWRDAPAPVAPSGAFTTLPEFSWSPVPFASAYEVQVSDTPFTDPATANPDTTPSPSTQGQPTGKVDTCFTVRTRVTFFTEHVKSGESNTGPCFSTLLGDGSPRYWRVRALDRPVDAATGGQTTPGAAAISYLPPSDTPDTKVGGECPGDTGGGCLPNNASEFSNWSSVTLFSVAISPPASGSIKALVPTASLASDPDHVCTVSNTGGLAEHATCSDFPTIRWAAVAAARRYRVTIGLDDQFSNVTRIIDTAGLSWTPTDSWAEAGPSTSFYYVVQACDNGCGNVTSTPPSFRKVTPRPVVGSAPAKTGEFALTWQSYAATLAAASGQAASQDAFSYRVQVATSDHPGYDAVVLDTNVDQTRLVPQTLLSIDGDFVWRVQPIDSANHALPWSLSQAFSRDATPPRLVSVAPSTNVAVKAPLNLTFSEPVTGLSSSTVSLSPAAAATLSVTSSTTATLVPSAALVPGTTYTLVVGSGVKDLAGNSAVASGPTVTVSPAVDDGSPALGYTSGWRSGSATNAVGGHFHVSSPTPSAHPSANLAFRGVGALLKSCVGPTGGYVDLYVDGVRRARVSSYRSFSGCGVSLAKVTGLARGLHTLRIQGSGSHASPSKGNDVYIDAVTVSP